MLVRVYKMTDGTQTIELVRLLKEAGNMSLFRAKTKVDQFLLGKSLYIEFECDESLHPDILEDLKSVGFLARIAD